jgi:hypothetical protein
MYAMWLDHAWISIPHAFASPKSHAMSLLPISKSPLIPPIKWKIDSYEKWENPNQHG